MQMGMQELFLQGKCWYPNHDVGIVNKMILL